MSPEPLLFWSDILLTDRRCAFQLVLWFSCGSSAAAYPGLWPTVLLLGS